MVNFPEEMSLNENATGGKGSWDFVRKIFCLNEKTYVEKLLDCRVGLYRLVKITHEIDATIRSVIKEERHSGSYYF